MKVRADRSELVDAVGWVAKMASPNSHLAALTGVVVEATDGWLTMRATDLERSGTVKIPAQVGEPGRVLLPAVLLSRLVGKLPADTVELVTDGTDAAMASGRVTAGLPLLAVEDFPNLPSVDDGPELTLTSMLAQSIADRVCPAASTEDKRPVLQGVRIEVAGGRLTAMCTDSYRMHLLDLPFDSDVECGATLSAAVPGQVAKLDAPAAVRVGEKLVEFDCGDAVLATAVLAGTMPPAEKILEIANGDPVVFDRAELVDALKRCSAVTAGRNNTPLCVAFDGGVATLDIGSRDFGTVSDAIEVEGEADPFKVRPDYLLQAVEGLGSERVRIGVKSLGALLVDDPAGDGAFRAVVMPMK